MSLAILFCKRSDRKKFLETYGDKLLVSDTIVPFKDNVKSLGPTIQQSENSSQARFESGGWLTL